MHWSRAGLKCIHADGAPRGARSRPFCPKARASLNFEIKTLPTVPRPDLNDSTVMPDLPDSYLNYALEFPPHRCLVEYWKFFEAGMLCRWKWKRAECRIRRFVFGCGGAKLDGETGHVVLRATNCYLRPSWAWCRVLSRFFHTFHMKTLFRNEILFSTAMIHFLRTSLHTISAGCASPPPPPERDADTRKILVLAPGAKKYA